MSAVKQIFLNSCQFLFLVMVNTTREYRKGAPLQKGVPSMNDFEQLATQYKNMIHSIIHALHVYKNQDEFYQIGLLALWDASKNFDEQKGSFSTYAYSFIKGRMLSLLRSEKKREDRTLYPSEEYWNSLECETRMMEKENILSYFHHLTDKQEKWALSHFYYGLSNKEIAIRENVSLSTVKNWKKLTLEKAVDRNQLKEVNVKR